MIPLSHLESRINDETYYYVSLLHRYMIDVWRLTRQVLRRRDSGERLEVVDEVRLIVVAAIERHLCPFNFLDRMGHLNNPLETADPREQLRSKSNLVAEQLDETALAATDLVNNSRYQRSVH